MTLRKKTLLAVGLTLSALIGLLWLFSQIILVQGFRRVELSDAEKNVGRVRDAIGLQMENLSVKMADWSAWDDAYQYVKDGNRKFEESNLVQATITSMKVELLVFRLPNGKIRWGQHIDLENGGMRPVSAEVLAHLDAHPELFAFQNEEDKKTGFIVLPTAGALVISSQPIITSAGTGPIAGTLLVGRKLNAPMIAAIEKLTHLKVAVQLAAGAPVTPDFAHALPHLKSTEDSFLDPLSDREIAGYTAFDDLYGQRALYIRMVTPRDIHAQGQSTVVYFLFAMMIAGFAFGIVITGILNKSVISRVTELSTSVEDIQRLNDLSLRVKVTSDDEITRLAVAMNRMLASIETSKDAMKLLLDNASQGFLSFDAQSIVGAECSAAATKIFGKNPAGCHLAQLLEQDLAKWNDFNGTVFSDALDFRDMAALFPKAIHLGEREVQLEYRPVRHSGKRLSHVLLVATDVTELSLLAKRGETERRKNLAIIRILGAKNDFLDLLDTLAHLETEPGSPESFRRSLHTLKGGFAFLECREIAETCHQWETRLSDEVAPREMKVCVVEIRAQVRTFIAEHERLLDLRSDSAKMIPVDAERLQRIIREAAELKVPRNLLVALETLAERSVSEVFSMLSGAFVDAGANLAKECAPIHWKTSVPINPEPYRELFKTFVHIVRNAADHGIEPSALREQLGKPAEGRMTAELVFGDGMYEFKFQDDGAGADYAAIRARARVAGATRELTEAECLDQLFASGFSTKAGVTEMSGRGVGLDAVRSAARELGGEAWATAMPGKGMAVFIRFQKRAPGFAENSGRLAA